MWEFLTTDYNITQQLAALVAVVAVAIIGVAILLISPTWRGFKNTYSFLSISEKRVIFKNLAWSLFLPTILIIITDIVGVNNPNLIQVTAIISITSILSIVTLYFSITWVTKFIALKMGSWETKVQETPKLEIQPLLYFSTLYWIVFCIFLCLVALLGVAAPMLNINIWLINQENFNWARWFLLDGIFCFVIGFFNFVYCHITQIIKNRKPDNDTNKPKKKRQISGWLVLLGLVLVIILNILTYTNISVMLPLDVKAYTVFNGTQFIFMNNSNFNWKMITFSINKQELSSGYCFLYVSLAQNETLTIDAKEFVNHEGMRLDTSAMKPLRFSIDVYDSSGRHGTYSDYYSQNIAALSTPLDIKASIDYQITYFQIKNDNDFDWENVIFSINKIGLSLGYTKYYGSIKQGEIIIVNTKEFANEDGLIFNPSTMKPTQFSIDVYNSEGQFGKYTGYLK